MAYIIYNHMAYTQTTIINLVMGGSYYILLSQFCCSIIFPGFQNYWKTADVLNIMFISHVCSHNLAASPPVKYGGD